MLLPILSGLAFAQLSDAVPYRPTAAFMAIVAGLAVVAGRRSALVAMVASAFVLDFLFVEPTWSVLPDSIDEVGGLLVFVASSLLVVVLVGQLERALQRAASNERQLAEATAQLIAREEAAAEGRFGTALDAMIDLITIHAPERDESGRVVDFRIEFANHPDLVQGGRPRADLVGRRLLDLYPALAGGEFFSRCLEVGLSGIPVTIDDVPATEIFPGVDIVNGWLTVQIAPFPGGIIIVVRDTTERHLNADRLERAYEQLAAAQRLAHIGIWSIDFETKKVSFSDEIAYILGLDEGMEVDWYPGIVTDLLVPNDRGKVDDFVARAFSDNGAFSTEVQADVGGRIRTISMFGQVTFDAAGVPRRLWGTAQDVTDQRQAERDLVDAGRRLEREHAIVVRLQEALRPELPESATVHVCASYLPAGTDELIGGDWYDAFFVDDDHLVVTIGDVAGHGLPAASLMAQLRNALRGAAYLRTSPPDAIGALDELVGAGADGAFATCIYGIYDLAAGRFAWSSAGHPPLLLVSADEPPRYLTGEVAPPLGFGRTTVPLHHVDLPPSALLLLYTDGLVERRGEPLDTGFERLRHAVASLGSTEPQEMCDHLGEIMFFGASRTDDVCILAIQLAGAHERRALADGSR